ncbi:hypothetical protein CDV36_016396 [Fusarium kuroshium]|uniref:Major facilitator superfamily (MFS) profile domain-containing protein n=1 Tax=Fusarium kuroshium TaxID=2010991 RepID=A0A3M2QRF7_9HYPO|nr:hypothetical protein CDV36_016396 [Fusarium kuroshium]
MAEIETAIEIEQQQNKRSYVDFFTTRGNKWRFAVVFLLGFMSQWAGNSLISYYLVIILNSIGIRDSYVQNLINGGLQIWNYFTGVIGAILVGRAARRRIFLVCVASMAGAFLIWTILSAINEQRNFKDGSLGIGVIFMIFIYYGFYNCSFLPLTIRYSLEVLPFTLRAKGMNIGNLTVNMASFFNGFVNPIALETIGWTTSSLSFCCVSGLSSSTCSSLKLMAALWKKFLSFDGPNMVISARGQMALEQTEEAKAEHA